MAAFYPDRALRASLLNGSSSNTNTPQALPLPSGSCNFRDLSNGTRAPVCGCKRFWLNNGNPNAQAIGGENAWCFCGHHACFHSAFSQQSAQETTSVSIIPENSPHAVARDTPEGYCSVHQAGAIAKQPAGLGIRPDSRNPSNSINTRVWEALNGFARNQEDHNYSDASKLPSTAAPSITGDFNEHARPMGPPINIPPHSIIQPGFEDYTGSATEIATPSISGTPDLQLFVPPGSQTRVSPARRPLVPAILEPISSQRLIDASQQPQSGGPSMSRHEIQQMLQAHTRRIEMLESLSFSQVPLEEVQDKFELFDGRLLDLEQWRSETQEHMQSTSEPVNNANTSNPPGSKRQRLFPADTSSFASDESFDSTAAAHTEAAVLATIAANAETRPRFEALENRVADLENAALPSFAHPWEVQVVFLPWGRDLRGIWFSSTEATQHSMRLSNASIDEWTSTQSMTRTSFRSSASGAWTTESIRAWAEDAKDWLSPKACGPTGIVFQRLASRGLVRNVTFTNSDSRHVLDVLSDAFSRIIPVDDVEHVDEMSRFHGLRETFLPLRKVRKSTRLRFMSPAEMITPATWTASMLESSLFMKVGDGQRRLYVTTPHAYLQSPETGWTWAMLKKLPARDSNGEQHAGQVHPSIAIEACWSYHDNLDRAPSLHTSFASDDSHASQWSSKSQHPAGEDVQAGGGQLTPALSASESKVMHQRTVSLPSSTSAREHARELLPKRRVASFETASTVPIIAPPEQESSKRRRISMSPEAERRGVNFTPRLSREPPSPFHSEPTGDVRSQGASSSRKRGNTPFAYATPHSTNNFVGTMDIIGDGDTERNTETDDHEHTGEEWDGMDEADFIPSEDVGSNDEDDDEGIDSEEGEEREEEDEDDMIYEHA